MKACVISLGCPKNLCDSEVLMGKLVAAGCQLTTKEKAADLFIVNTCAFLKSAREEALQTIKSLRKYRKKIYMAGCLPKFNREVHSQVDGLIDSLGLHPYSAPRIHATPPWTAYVKIAEGCDNRCSYCLIPQIRGRLKTRKVIDILKEVKNLAKRGVKEIIFVAQDTTAHPQFADILRKTAGVKGIRWIRILYAHPAHLTDKIIKIIKTERKIVKYLDLPIQHICDRILGLMNRSRLSGYEILNLILKLRREIPEIKLRTSLIVGFPGETREEFEKLVDLIKCFKFDRLGVFEYSRERGTPAAKMRGQVPEKVKRFRFHKLMTIQNRISRELNHRMIGKTIEVLTEGPNRGRTAFDAPQIDGSVKINKKVKPGEFVKVKVTGARAYELSGRFVST